MSTISAVETSDVRFPTSRTDGSDAMNPAPDYSAAYEHVHALIGDARDAALRVAGVTGWSIWHSGRDLFHVVAVADYQAMRKELAADPVNIAWQAVMGGLLEVEGDYSGDGMGLAKVWELP